MTELTIKETQQIVDKWIKTVGVRYFSELTILAQLVEDVGEVARRDASRHKNNLKLRK